MTTSYLDTRKRRLPFLEVSQSSIEYISTHLKDAGRCAGPGCGRGQQASEERDMDNIITFWTTLTKASEVIQNGRRLENLSWRLINRKLILHDDITPADFSAIASVSKGTRCKELRESHHNRKKLQKRPGGAAGSTEHIPTSSSSVHTDSSSSLNTSLASSSFTQSNAKTVSAAAKKKAGSHLSSPSALSQPNPTNVSRVPSLFRKTSSQTHSATHTPDGFYEKPVNERKTQFFIDHSSPESSSMSPPNFSPHAAARESIVDVMQSSVTGSGGKARQDKSPKTSSNGPPAGSVVTSLFGAKNNSMHSLVNQVQRNQSRRPDPALPNNTAKQPVESNAHLPPGNARSELQLHTGARLSSSSLFVKDRTHTPDKPHNSSSEAPSKQQVSSQQQQQQQQQQLQQRHQHRLRQLQQQQQQLQQQRIANNPPLKKLPGDLKTEVKTLNLQNLQIKSNASQVSMASAASSTRSHASQASTASLFPNKKSNHNEDHAEEENEEGGLSFQKQTVVTDDEAGNKTKPVLKRSLLSGLFLDQMGKQQPDTNTEEGNTTGKLERAPGSLSPRKSGGAQIDTNGDSISSLFSAGAKQTKGHYDSHHRSNAPPTAATLLPTALATHMFLPTKNFQTFQSVQRQQYSGQPQKPQQIGQQKPHTNHHSPHSQQQQQHHPHHQHHHHHQHQHQHQHHPHAESSAVATQQKQVPVLDNELNITKLTKDNIAKYANAQVIKPGTDAEGEPEVEYASSIKTSTSSIDIPGSENRIMKEQRRKERQLEMKSKKLAAGDNGDGNVVPAPGQLPSNLVDSIFKENMALFGHPSRNATTSSLHESDVLDDPDSSSTVVEIAKHHLDAANLIEKGEDDPVSMLEKRAAVFTSDGFIDDSIVRKIYGGDVDDDEDNMNYHARGW
ncbi:hypothetical protein PICMEDRAFT_63411 [Pichia membranifaciens NRRL Y-2026]|uniref:Nitrogen regulatory protein areA GATA-like domain-containing protein n=1 Tax=Pichia membranifaciens NRRL Y-2026 TaxID=763406 RepID=A0A1E3NK48_9ASCO|nr:hypothetical protein PICMEDRAFT_63411 [Pichia membranifaciens NRRL Y-2026]ODQ46499.1 hypothetical protein PICMEDRAFT_63411 [Pichia membranifaciens NRRL Y-2026]